MKSYKKFMHDIHEEWVDNTPRTGDIFKNPTPREMAEYAKSLQFESDMAGLLINNDLYMFSGGLHDDALDALARKGVKGTVVKFRGDMTRQGKIESIGPTGGLVNTRTPAARKKLFDQMAKVYNHKIIQRYVDKNDPYLAMGSVRAYFSYEKAFDEFTQLMKSTFGK